MDKESLEHGLGVGKISNFTRSGTYNMLWWASKSTRFYQVERRENFDAASPWETIGRRD